MKTIKNETFKERWFLQMFSGNFINALISRAALQFMWAGKHLWAVSKLTILWDYLKSHVIVWATGPGKEEQDRHSRFHSLETIHRVPEEPRVDHIACLSGSICGWVAGQVLMSWTWDSQRVCDILCRVEKPPLIRTNHVAALPFPFHPQLPYIPVPSLLRFVFFFCASSYILKLNSMSGVIWSTWKWLY